MAETRTVKVSVVMTPSLRDELDAYAEAHDWTASTAAVNLIRQALEAYRISYAEQTTANSQAVADAIAAALRTGPDSTGSAQGPG